jgi:hypothetical protein
MPGKFVFPGFRGSMYGSTKMDAFVIREKWGFDAFNDFMDYLENRGFDACAMSPRDMLVESMRFIVKTGLILEEGNPMKAENQPAEIPQWAIIEN